MQVDELPTVGVVGLSEAGRRYASVARDLGCEVVGADASEKARRQFEDSVAAETFEDFEAMYGEEVGAVVVSTPNRYHEATAVPALAAGLDVFFEKPLAHDYESAQRIVDAAEASDSVCMVGYYNTLYECVQAVRSYIDDGHFGDISHVQATWVFRRAVPRRGSWYTSRELAGGGVLQDKGSFMLHLLASFGFPLDRIESVAAKTRTNFAHEESYSAAGGWGAEGREDIFDVEDSVSAFLEFEDGKTATIETAWALNGRREHSYQIRGTEAGAYLDMDEAELTVHGIDERDPGSIVDTEVRPGFSEDVFEPETAYGFVIDEQRLRRRAFETFCRCAAADERPERGRPERALAVQRAIADIYDAADDPGIV